MGKRPAGKGKGLYLGDKWAPGTTVVPRHVKEKGYTKGLKKTTTYGQCTAETMVKVDEHYRCARSKEPPKPPTVPSRATRSRG